MTDRNGHNHQMALGFLLQSLEMCIDVFGEGWGEFKIAHLSTSDGVGIELFSFPIGVKKAPEFSPFNTGLFHFCVQDPEIENLVAEIVAAGGKQRMPIREYYPNEKPFKMCYVEDPFGIVFEIYPLLKSQIAPDNSLRLGFNVQQLDALLDKLKKEGIDIVKEPTQLEWGYVAIIKDLDGRKIELKEVK